MPAGRNLTSRVARRAGGSLRGFLALAACLLLLTPAASAQFALPGKGPASKPEAAASPAEQRAQTEAELAEAQRQQAALETDGRNAGHAPVTSVCACWTGWSAATVVVCTCSTNSPKATARVRNSSGSSR